MVGCGDYQQGVIAEDPLLHRQVRRRTAHESDVQYVLPKLGDRLGTVADDELQIDVGV